MPTVVIHSKGDAFSGEVKEDTNLVVRAGIKQFPYPRLAYKCGMGKCGTCASHILAGAEHLPPPNWKDWKEKKQLGDKIDEGFRLVSQLWIKNDIELRQEKVTEQS